MSENDIVKCSPIRGSFLFLLFSQFSGDLGRYFAKLRSLIESLFLRNGQRKVIVLAHSMGNPVANHFYHNFVDQARPFIPLPNSIHPTDHFGIL